MQIQIPDKLGAWLQETAARLGKSPDELVSEAVQQSLEDREDYEDALETSRRIQRGEEKTYSLDEVERRLGLDD